jgi:hypothetical protein
MLTYNRGKWEEDKTLSDDWSIGSGDKLAYPGFSSLVELNLGDEYSYHANVWWPSEENKSKYQYFVELGTGNCGHAVLVTDYPSLLMLLKEVEPIIRLDMDFQRFQMQEEEHRWLAKKNGVKRGEECSHL